MTPDSLPGLSDITGYSFRDPQILKRALTRKAFCQEQNYSEGMHMDAFATLGDAVIELHILSALVRDGGSDKGEISVRKMDLVNMSMLRQVAERIRMDQYVSWGNGEKRNHIWTSGRVLAECIEALIGAVFIDGGYDSAGRVMEKIGLTPELRS